MKRLQMLVLCAVAALACSAALAASASATEVPTWFECAKAPKIDMKYTGDYNNKLCRSFNARGRGKFVLREGVGRDRRYKGKSGPAVFNVQTWLGDATVTCAKSQDSITPKLPNEVISVEVVFKECETGGSLPAKKCSSALQMPGEIRLHAMRGTVGYISESPLTVGIKLGLESEPGGTVAEFACEGLEVTVAGELVAVQEKDINAVSREPETVFTAAEYLGEVEYEGHRFSPLVNWLGFEDELEAIDKGEAQPNVLTAKLCGAIIQVAIGTWCTPEPVPAGENLTIASTGQRLMIKT
ncbi:MAG TPA: hypothetical protein VMF09_08230 [Solirubrobacteraceae bacterium]|nr:hypothetical protein [Solirubrobacteraceae bacterium]